MIASSLPIQNTKTLENLTKITQVIGDLFINVHILERKYM